MKTLVAITALCCGLAWLGWTQGSSSAWRPVFYDGTNLATRSGLGTNIINISGGGTNDIVGNLAHLSTNQATANGWEWTDDGTDVTITAYDHTLGGGVRVTIPDTIGDLPVTGMVYGVFGSAAESNVWLISVSGAGNIETFGDDAFVTCVNLVSADLFSAITLNSQTFAYCDSLESVNVPSATNVTFDTFAYCPLLTSVTFGETVPVLGGTIYDGSANVTNYYPAGATAWLALDPQELGGRPAVMVDTHATTLSSVALGRKTLDEIMLADGSNIETNSTVDWTGADIRIADAISADSPTTLKDVLDIVQDFSTKIIYGSTNAHPIIAGAGSMWDVPPTNEQTYATLIDANNTDFDAGAWYYTNKVSFIRPGKYFGRFFATRSGGAGVTGKMRLVYTNVVTGANGIIDESSLEPIADTALRSYRLSASVLDSISCTNENIYLGVGMTFRKTGANNSTVTIYMGDPYDTHLETPGLGKPEGFVTQADLDAADDAIYASIATNYVKLTDGVATNLNVDGLTIEGELSGDNRLPLTGAQYGTDDGLVAWYRLDGDALDSASTNNGTWTGTEAYTNAVRWEGASYSTNTAISRIDAGSWPEYQYGTNALTFGAWVRAGDVDFNSPVINFRTGPGRGMNLQIRGAGYAFYRRNNDGLDGVELEFPITNILYFIVCVFDPADVGSQMKLYVDGILGGSSASTRDLNSAPALRIGGDGSVITATPNDFRGFIDEVRIYNRALSASEITELYERDRDWFKSHVDGDLDVDGDARISGDLRVDGAAQIGETIRLANTTKPTAATGFGWIYAKTNEVYVLDGTGNETLISPHGGSDAWTFYSRNDYTGREIIVDMEGMIRALERVSGEKLMQVSWHEPTQVWGADEAAKVARRDADIAAWDAEAERRQFEEPIEGEPELEPMGERPEPYTPKPAPQWITDRLKQRPEARQ